MSGDQGDTPVGDKETKPDAMETPPADLDSESPTSSPVAADPGPVAVPPPATMGPRPIGNESPPLPPAGQHVIVASEPQLQISEAERRAARQDLKDYEKWAKVGMALSFFAMFGVTIWQLASEDRLYNSLFDNARNATRACPDAYLYYTAALAPFRSFSFFRSSVVFLSFGLIALGGTFIFARVRASFALEGSVAPDQTVKLSSEYAGILMLTIGAALVAFGLYRTASPRLEGIECDPNPVWVKEENTSGRPLNQSYSLNFSPETPHEQPADPAASASGSSTTNGGGGPPAQTE